MKTLFKRKLSLILAIILIAGVCSACGGNSQELSKDSASSGTAAAESTGETSSEGASVSEDAPSSAESENAASAQQSAAQSSGAQSSSSSRSSGASTASGDQSSGASRTSTAPGTGNTTTQTNTHHNTPSSNGGNSQSGSQNSGSSTSSSKPSSGGNTQTSQSGSKPSQSSKPSQQTSKPSQGGSGSSQSSQGSSTPQPAPTNNDSVGDISLYNCLWNVANNIKVELTVPQAEMNKLQADYQKYKNIDSKSPIYRKASLTIWVNGQRFSMDEVGIRLKGNMWLAPVYDSSGNLNLSHYKLSFNETFDNTDYYGSEAKVWASKEERKARKNRRFATLKKMDLKWNNCYDDTYVREIYAAKMFRENGVLVQNIGLANVVVNGNNHGVMRIYEPVDEIFLEKNLPASALGGDLYKCGWTRSPCNYVRNQVSFGVDDKDTGAKFNYNLKTNEKSSNHSSLSNLLRVLASNPDKNSYASVIDTDYLANFLAASYFAGDPDDMRNNYNNHYVYFRKDNGKAIFIPYDNDRTMGLTYGYNPDGTGMTKPSPYSDRACGAGHSQANPMINLGIVRSNGYIRNEYTAALKRIAGSGIMNENNFNVYYELARNNYQGVVNPSVYFANQKQQFKFSLDGKYSSSDRQNMSFAEFSQRIMKTFNAEVK